jgi:hypothetical protein
MLRLKPLAGLTKHIRSKGEDQTKVRPTNLSAAGGIRCADHATPLYPQKLA